jgi:hypothetical protein
MRRISTSLATTGVAAALLVTPAAMWADDSNPPTLTVRVTSVQSDGSKIVGRGTNGEQKTILLGPSTAIERHGPGDGSEAARGPMKARDITPGDRILVGGEQKGDVVSAKRIQVIGPSGDDESPTKRRSDEEGDVDEGRTGRGSGVGSGPGPGTPESGSGTN